MSVQSWPRLCLALLRLLRFVVLLVVGVRSLVLCFVSQGVFVFVWLSYNVAFRLGRSRSVIVIIVCNNVVYCNLVAWVAIGWVVVVVVVVVRVW